MAVETILIADDEIGIRDLFQMALEHKGYMVLTAQDGVEALDLFAQYGVDLIILDIRMPRLDGFRACREIRQSSTVPIIICSVLNSADDIAFALDQSGADDYITKPCSFDLLEARIQSLLRRISWAERPLDLQIIRRGSIELDAETRLVDVGTRIIRLSPLETKLLHYLMSRPGQLIRKEAILQAVWGYVPAGRSIILHTNISRLRRKVEKDPSTPRMIETIPHLGYRFNTDG